MVNLHEEAHRIQTRLQLNNLDPRTIEMMLAALNMELEQAINTAADYALQEARRLGSGLGEDFLSSMTIIRDHSGVKIGTSTGQTGFFLPPLPMLPRLLKNAKVSKKTGMRYKQIPIAQTRPVNGPPNMFDGQAAFNAAGAQKGASKSRNHSGSVVFRTATSNQNPATQWVLPEKKIDAAPLLDYINQQLEQNVKVAVDHIIERYGRQY